MKKILLMLNVVSLHSMSPQPVIIQQPIQQPILMYQPIPESLPLYRNIWFVGCCILFSILCLVFYAFGIIFSDPDMQAALEKCRNKNRPQ